MDRHASEASRSRLAKEALKSRMTGYWPGAPLEVLIMMSADPMAAELVADRPESPRRCRSDGTLLS
jgi:hypothetical protein